MELPLSRFYIKLTLFGLIASSCTKDGKNITVQGRVLNPVTGEGIANVEIRLLKETTGSPGTSGGYKAVESVYSDANGSFELNHTSWFPRLVACYPDENVYYNLGWAENGTFLDTYFEKVKLGRFTNLDYWAVPYGMLAMQIENINCEGTTDEMQFRFKSQFDDDYQYWSPIYLGCYSNTFNTQQTPMGFLYFETKVIRPSGTTYVYDTVFISETGVTTAVIEY